MSEAQLGDMPPEEFREYGHQLIDWIADYLEKTDQYPVLSQVKPGDLKQEIPASPPDQGEPMVQILKDFERTVLPGITHWNHPSFFSYFSITGSPHRWPSRIIPDRQIESADLSAVLRLNLRSQSHRDSARRHNESLVGSFPRVRYY